MRTLLLWKMRSCAPSKIKKMRNLWREYHGLIQHSQETHRQVGRENKRTGWRGRSLRSWRLTIWCDPSMVSQMKEESLMLNIHCWHLLLPSTCKFLLFFQSSVSFHFVTASMKDRSYPPVYLFRTPILQSYSIFNQCQCVFGCAVRESVCARVW